jgi:hypothetical protein
MKQVLGQNDLEASIKTELVKNTMLMLQTFFSATEKSGGTAGIRPHAALDCEPVLIENLLFTSYLNNNDNFPRHILMSVSSNMTVWELVDYIALKTNKSPIKLQISRSAGKPDIKSFDYSKSLKEMKFESGEEITVIRYTGSY